MTPLSKRVVRSTPNTVRGRAIVVTLSPGKGETLVGLRLAGQRTQYVIALSDVYRMAALWHGNAEAAARRKARKDGIPWARARKEFLKSRAL